MTDEEDDLAAVAAVGLVGDKASTKGYQVSLFYCC